MNGSEVHRVLQSKGVRFLYHANSVTTSCSILRLRGLASRGAVEAAGLPQTPQASDATDKQFGVWHDVFTDGVDVHYRARKRNLYGPVLFQLPLDALLHLPRGTEVMVARRNPIYWMIGQQVADHYFVTVDELNAGYHYGDFEKHIALRTPSGIVPFPNASVEVTLDNPNYTWEDGRDVYSVAVEKLQHAAQDAGLVVEVAPRACRDGCHCAEAHHTGYTSTVVSEMF
jgi:hypothetical protein